MNLVPFYYEEAKQNYIETKQIENELKNFEFNDTPIIVHKTIGHTTKYKEIDIGGIR